MLDDGEAGGSVIVVVEVRGVFVAGGSVLTFDFVGISKR